MTAQSYDDRDGFIWMDGEMVPWRDAQVHVLTHAMHYGSAVFEGQRAYGGQVFELEAHTARLFESARMLDLKVPFSEANVNDACRLVLAKSGYSEAYQRPIIWRGSEMMGVAAQANTIHVAVACWSWPAYFDPNKLAKGIRLDLAEWRRPAPECAPVHAKAAGLYMICTLSKHAAEAKGYDDALMLDYRGQVAEATGANVFFVKDGVIHTPPADCFLNGITRRTVMGLAERRGIKVIERKIELEELEGFEGCFLTGTAAEVTPVGEIGPYSFDVGPIIQQLIQDYQTAVYAHRERASA